LRKWLKILVAIIVFLFLAPTVSAQGNSIEAIDIQVELHDDGSATIHETRQMETHEDTELYIDLNNLQDTELLDFQVEGFTENEDWDIDASFEEKANEYGVIETDDGYELAWGITEYGTPEYNLSYSLSNLVRELNDGQALHWNFDTFLSLPTDRMTLEVTAPFNLENEVLDFYGFGFEGPIDINEGTLEWTGYGLDESNDVTVMMQFPKGTFATSATADMTLEEQRELAVEGSSYNEEGPMPTWVIVLFSIMGLLGGGAIITSIVYGVRNRNIKKEYNHFNPVQLARDNKDKMTQQPPELTGDIGRYEALISQLAYAGGGFSDFFFAYLILWSLDERLIIETSEKERFLVGPKTEAEMTIINYEEELELNELSFSEYVDLFEMGESTLEEAMWTMLLEAADTRGVIDGDDIENWSQDNAEDVADLIEIAEEVSFDWLEDNGYLKQHAVKDLGATIEVKEMTEKGERLVTHIIQFDNFLSNIDEASLAEYDNWHELIIWAALLGKAEDTVEHLKEFHPNTWSYLIDTYPYIYGHYYGYHYFYTSNTAGLTTGGYAAGAGGFSSAGGGAGAGGGGGGGSR